MKTNLELECANLLVSQATDYACTYLDNEEDWDAGVVALLACAIEIASGKKIKPLTECFERKNHELQ